MVGLGLAAVASAAGVTPPPAVGCLECHASHYAAVAGCVDCHRGDARATRPLLAHHRLLGGAAAAWALPGSPVLARAVVLRDSLGCRRCHVTGGKGERLAIDLDSVVWARTQAELQQALMHPAQAMPDFGLGPASADTLAAVLLRDGDHFGGASRYQVRFRAGSQDSLQAFAKLCGGCHQALTIDGRQGVGTAGPNLSGLLGPFYPAQPDSAWKRDRLERWLRNPRAMRAGATMLPVALKPGELEAVLRVLAPPPPAGATQPVD